MRRSGWAMTRDMSDEVLRQRKWNKYWISAIINILYAIHLHRTLLVAFDDMIIAVSKREMCQILSKIELCWGFVSIFFIINFFVSIFFISIFFCINFFWYQFFSGINFFWYIFLGIYIFCIYFFCSIFFLSIFLVSIFFYIYLFLYLFIYFSNIFN